MAKSKKTTPESGSVEGSSTKYKVGDAVSIPCRVVEVGEELITLETELPWDSDTPNRFAVRPEQVVGIDDIDKTDGDTAKA